MDIIRGVVNRQRSFPVRFESELSGEHSQYGYGRGESPIESKQRQEKSYRRSYSDSEVRQNSRGVTGTSITGEMELESQVIRQLQDQNPFLKFHVTFRHDDLIPRFDQFKNAIEESIVNLSKQLIENSKYEKAQILNNPQRLRKVCINHAIEYYIKEIQNDFIYISKSGDESAKDNAKNIIKEYKITNNAIKDNKYSSNGHWNLLYICVRMEVVRIHCDRRNPGKIVPVDYD